MDAKQILGGIIIGGAIAVYGIYYFNQQQNELMRLINNGASIMGFQPHPDDCEAFTPGIFIISGGDRENECWIVSAIPVDQIPPDQQEERAAAIAWFEENYLEEYIFLNGRPLIYEEVKSQLIDVIEAKQPDILLTFTPFGWYGHREHITISNIITDLWDELSYAPKVYWFVAAGQGPSVPSGPYDMRETYPPTDILNSDIYSEALAKTFWEAKLEVYEHYRSSVPGIDTYLNDEEAVANNDRKEYFRRHK